MIHRSFLFSYKYDENGRKTVYANQDVENVELINDVMTVKNQDGDVYTVEADKTENSEVVNYIDNDIEIKYNYNEFGDIEKIESNTGFTVNYTYPAADEVVSVETTVPTAEVIKEKIETAEVEIVEETDVTKEPVNTEVAEITEKPKEDAKTEANLSWNGKQLVSVVQDGKKVELTYDANGIINCKKVNGKDTIYDIEGKDYIREVRDGKELVYVYDSKANVVGFMYEGNNYYYVKNCLGDVIAIVDSDYKEQEILIDNIKDVFRTLNYPESLVKIDSKVFLVWKSIYMGRIQM
ncbi:MAG: hypothetical protein K6G26_14080 [Lachnospiraceae bacterium]|nr:hypothetical protein [Lachnospiraceae bacterium]